MKKLFAILCLLAAVGAAQAIDYGTPYTGSTPQIYTQPVQTSMTIGGYSTVATGGMTTTGEGGLFSGPMRAEARPQNPLDGQTWTDQYGNRWVWDAEAEEWSKASEVDAGNPQPVGDTIWPLMLMAMAFLLLRLRRRKQQEA